MDTYKNKRVVGVFESGNRKELSKKIARLLEAGYSKEDITIYANSITMEAFGMSKGINVQHRTKREEDEDTDKSFWERIKGTFTVEEPNYDDESSILNPFKASLEPYLKVLEEGGVLLTVTSTTPPSTDSGENSSQVDDVYTQHQNRNVQTPSSPLDESWNHPPNGTNPMETDTVRDTHAPQPASKENPANHLDTTRRTVDHKGVGDYLNEDNEAENRDPDHIKPE